MAETLTQRRLRELRDERELVESIIRCITRKLALPDKAAHYLKTNMGGNTGGQYDGSAIQTWLFGRLEAIREEMARQSPAIHSLQTAAAIGVLGDDQKE